MNVKTDVLVSGNSFLFGYKKSQGTTKFSIYVCVHACAIQFQLIVTGHVNNCHFKLDCFITDFFVRSMEFEKSLLFCFSSHSPGVEEKAAAECMSHSTPCR